MNWSECIPAVFLRSSVAVQSVLEPASPREVKILARAIKALAEDGTLSWVKDLNFDVGRALKSSCCCCCCCLMFEAWCILFLRINLEGVAPPSSAMGVEFESRRAKLARQRNIRDLNVLGKIGKKWFKRFRKRWCITSRKLKERRHTLHQKSWQRKCPSSMFLFALLVQILGPFFDPKNWTTLVTWCCMFIVACQMAPFLGPVFGPKNWTQKVVQPTMFLAIKVRIFLTWNDWLLASAALVGREPVVINLDETSVCYPFHGARGNVVQPGLWPSKHQPPTANSSLSHRRGMFTHVGMVTSRDDLQTFLPQILIGSREKFT